MIDFLVLFNGSESRRIATRCRRVANSLKAAGRRYTRFAPFGFTEIRAMTFRGLELLRAAESPEADPAVHPA